MEGPARAGGFVLVGGESRRMGRAKGLLELRGRPLALRAAELLRPYVAEVTLLGPPEQFGHLGLRVLADRRPGRGPLEALSAALVGSPYEWNLFLACDLPFLEGKFLETLLGRAQAGQAQAVVPRTAGGWQPLCAAYHRACVPVMEQALARDSTGIVEVLPALKVDVVGSQELARLGFSDRLFRNINTPADWEVAQRELELTRT
jgi:molybdopterin-guanine dinucleotide biosynthesis protein B/molybdopterin-guanine dinucleotide biosynthesis protein